MINIFKSFVVWKNLIFIWSGPKSNIFLFFNIKYYLFQRLRKGASTPLGFQADIVINFTYLNSSRENFHTRFQDFYSFCTFQTLHGKSLGREKNDFSLADSGISPKNRIQAAVKILNDGEIVWKLYVMLKGPLKIY